MGDNALMEGDKVMMGRASSPLPIRENPVVSDPLARKYNNNVDKK